MSLIPATCFVGDILSDFAKHTFWKENAEKVCDDEEDIGGKVVIVTGSNSGIGKQAAMQLAKRGATLIMAVRNLEKGEAALEEIKKQLDGRPVTIELMKMDLGDLQSLRDFVTTFESKYDHLDILVNNAGYMNTTPGLQKTKDGFEQHVGVNHLGPFLLTRLLLPSLKKSKTPSRIVCVESSKLASAPLNFMDDLMMEKKVRTGDSGMEQYDISKLASAMCNKKLVEDKALMGDVKLLQLCPGIVKTELFSNETGFLKKMGTSMMLGAVGLTTHQGCETMVYCSVSKSVVTGEDSGKGEIYRAMKIWKEGNKTLNKYLASPEGMDTQNTLYMLSEKLVGLNTENGSGVTNGN